MPSPVRLWIAPGADELAVDVRAALSEALRARGRTLVADAASSEVEPSLHPRLVIALEAYKAMHLDEAITALSQISTAAQKLGGGDLDTRALSDLYLLLGFTALERGASDLAWDSFVRAVRIDPTRALDPAQVPPRAAATHRRAQAELAQQPTVQLELRIPAGARARVDGDEGHAAGPLPRRLIPGAHFVRVELLGYEPYRGIVSLSSPTETFAPVLRPLAAPVATALDEANGFASLHRSGDGWRVSLRVANVGVLLDASSQVHREDADRVVRDLADRVFGAAPSPKRKPLWKRWWVWTAAGVAIAAVAIAVPLGVNASRGSAPGSVGGPLEPIR